MSKIFVAEVIGTAILVLFGCGAAVIAGAHPDFKTAQAAMTGLKDVSYKPIPENQVIYQKLYSLYLDLHDAFGGVSKSADLGHVMKDLLALKAQQTN